MRHFLLFFLQSFCFFLEKWSLCSTLLHNKLAKISTFKVSQDFKGNCFLSFGTCRIRIWSQKCWEFFFSTYFRSFDTCAACVILPALGSVVIQRSKDTGSQQSVSNRALRVCTGIKTSEISWGKKFPALLTSDSDSAHPKKQLHLIFWQSTDSSDVFHQE